VPLDRGVDQITRGLPVPPLLPGQIIQQFCLDDALAFVQPGQPLLGLSERPCASG